MSSRKIVLLAALVVAIGVGLTTTFSQKNEGGDAMNDKIPSSNLKLTSEAFADGTAIPSQYTCKGQNISPPLTIAGVSTEAKSLALIMHDPDAPAGDWLHWTLWNISPTTTQIEQDSTPAGALSGTTDFGRSGYGGPCPPSGTHHYLFDLYALDRTLDLKAGASRSQLEAAISNSELAKTTLTGLFSAN